MNQELGIITFSNLILLLCLCVVITSLVSFILLHINATDTKSRTILIMIMRTYVRNVNQFYLILRSLARTRNPKNPDHKYFSVSPVGDVDVLGECVCVYVCVCVPVFVSVCAFSVSEFDALAFI
jgi:hypothetical protein